MNHKEINKLNKKLGFDISVLGNAIDMVKLEQLVKYEKEEEEMNKRNARLEQRAIEASIFTSNPNHNYNQMISDYVATENKTSKSTVRTNINNNKDVEVIHEDDLKQTAIYNKETKKLEFVPTRSLKKPKTKKTRKHLGETCTVVKEDKHTGEQVLVDPYSNVWIKEKTKQPRLLRRKTENGTIAKLILKNGETIEVDYSISEDYI